MASASDKVGSPRLQIAYVQTSLVKAAERKLRRHSREQLARMVKSVEAFGALPIIVDADKQVIDGHTVLAAVRKLGLKEVPVICRDDLDETQARTLRIALNRIGELSEWEHEDLWRELDELGDLGLDLELTGFNQAELDELFLSGVQADETIDLPNPLDSSPPGSRPGDLWTIGQHRVICGDAREQAVLNELLRGEQAQMIFTDPPFNMPIDGVVAGIHQPRFREFAMGAGEMSEAQYAAFLGKSLSAMAANARPGAILYLCIDWRNVQRLLAGAEQAGLEVKNICVWAKTNFGMGSFYRSQHELVVVLKVPGGEHIRNFGPGTKGRNRTNLWSYAGVNGFSRGRAEALAVHPTVKPVAMIADAIRDCSKRAGIILDPFCGSGSTLVAAHRTGRRGYGVEIDPLYVDTIVRRMEQETGEQAVRQDRVSFAEASSAAARKEAA